MLACIAAHKHFTKFDFHRNWLHYFWTKRQKYASIFLMMLTKACFKSLCACESWRLPQKLFRVHGVLWTIWQELWIWKAETRWPRSYYSRPPISVRTKFQRNLILSFLHLFIKCTHWVLKLCHTCYKLCVTCNKLPIEMVTTKYCKKM